MTTYFFNPAHRCLFFTTNPDQQPPSGYGKWLINSLEGTPERIAAIYHWAHVIHNPEPYYDVYPRAKRAIKPDRIM